MVVPSSYVRVPTRQDALNRELETIAGRFLASGAGHQPLLMGRDFMI